MTSQKIGPHEGKNILEEKVESLSSTLTNFIDTQLLSSTLLLACMIIAVVVSNLPLLSSSYFKLTNTTFGVHLSNVFFTTTFKDFVNDFLLTIFFFALGLEIKREFVIGELSAPSKSVYVILCASGGALLPIVTYLSLNHTNPDTIHGWAIPMATDTALAIGVLYLFKNSVSKQAFTLLASLAVLDDIFSIIIIAIFYSTHFSLTMFLAALVILLLLVIINLCGLRHPLFYVSLGFLLWIFLEKGGIHGTIAGVLVAMCIPARPKKKPKVAVKKIRGLLNEFENQYDDEKHLLEEDHPHKLLEGVQHASLEATTPLKRWENGLEFPVLIFILPLFALTNGGFSLNFIQIQNTLQNSLFWGIFLGLIIAKPLGVFLAAWLAKKSGIAKPPAQLTSSDLLVIALLSGIGYTMSIFISELAFDSKQFVDMAKLSIFISAIFSSLMVTSLMMSCKRKDKVVTTTSRND